jgi:hypothetical protein
MIQRAHRIAFALSSSVFGMSALWASPALAQVIGKGGDDGISLWRVVAAFLFCCLLAACAAILLKKRFGGGASLLRLPFSQDRRLQLVESLRLSHQVDLCLVRCDGDELLVAASAAGVVLLNKRGVAGSEV